jgi:hypothetical protein
MPRLEVAVISRDGTARVVNAARPATLVAFEDAHPGKQMPESIREVMWVAHHALGVDEPLDEWIGGLEDVSAQDEDVKLAKRIIAGDEEARAIALGEADAPLPEESETPDPTSEETEDPAIWQLEESTPGVG